jgi:hypothetical protein
MLMPIEEVDTLWQQFVSVVTSPYCSQYMMMQSYLVIKEVEVQECASRKGLLRPLNQMDRLNQKNKDKKWLVGSVMFSKSKEKAVLK